MDREIEREGRWGQVRGGRGVGGVAKQKRAVQGGWDGEEERFKGRVLFVLFCCDAAGNSAVYKL